MGIIVRPQSVLPPGPKIYSMNFGDHLYGANSISVSHSHSVTYTNQENTWNVIQVSTDGVTWQSNTSYYNVNGVYSAIQSPNMIDNCLMYARIKKVSPGGSWKNNTTWTTTSLKYLAGYGGNSDYSAVSIYSPTQWQAEWRDDTSFETKFVPYQTYLINSFNTDWSKMSDIVSGTQQQKQGYYNGIGISPQANAYSVSIDAGLLQFRIRATNADGTAASQWQYGEACYPYIEYPGLGLANRVSGNTEVFVQNRSSYEWWQVGIQLYDTNSNFVGDTAGGALGGGQWQWYTVPGAVSSPQWMYCNMQSYHDVPGWFNTYSRVGSVGYGYYQS